MARARTDENIKPRFRNQQITEEGNVVRPTLNFELESLALPTMPQLNMKNKLKSS